MRITRDEAIERANLKGRQYISLYTNLSDTLAVMYHLTPSNKLVNPYSKPVPKSATFEGWLKYDKVNQAIIKVPFNAEDKEIG